TRHARATRKETGRGGEKEQRTGRREVRGGFSPLFFLPVLCSFSPFLPVFSSSTVERPCLRVQHRVAQAEHDPEHGDDRDGRAQDSAHSLERRLVLAQEQDESESGPEI